MNLKMMNELSKRHLKLSLIFTLNIAFFILITEHVFYESIIQIDVFARFYIIRI